MSTRKLPEYEVIDADAHVIETEATWRYLEPHERRFRPQLVSESSDSDKNYWVVDGRVVGPPILTDSDSEYERKSAASPRNIATPQAARKLEDIPLRLEHMSQIGTDTQVLHNSIFIEQITERPDLEIALCRSWNRWLAEIYAEGRGRLRWTCVVPTLTIDAALAEIRFAKEHGAVGVCLPPFDRSLMVLDEYYYPIFALSEGLDLPIIIHVSNNDPALMRSLRTRSGLLDGFASFRVPTVVACYGLLGSEVVTSFPKLRWGFIEASAQWVPWVMGEYARRTAAHYTSQHNGFVDHDIYVSTQIGDDLAYITASIGEDRLVIGTDYGHTDTSSEVDAITQFEELELDEALREKVLCSNPRRLYGLAPLFECRSGSVGSDTGASLQS